LFLISVSGMVLILGVVLLWDSKRLRRFLHHRNLNQSDTIFTKMYVLGADVKSPLNKRLSNGWWSKNSYDNNYYNSKLRITPSNPKDTFYINISIISRKSIHDVLLRIRDVCQITYEQLKKVFMEILGKDVIDADVTDCGEGKKYITNRLDCRHTCVLCRGVQPTNNLAEQHI